MNPTSTPAAPADNSRSATLLPLGVDKLVLLFLVIGFAVLFLPYYWELSSTVWASDEQGHGPIILVVSGWLFYTMRHRVAAAAGTPARLGGWSVLVLAMLLYIIGRSQQILLFQGLSQILVLVSMLLLFAGRSGLRVAWFPLFFLLFMVPLPEALVANVTGPLKSAVSAVASSLLYQIGYPVGRSGVIMTVGPYQLLVADACAGLNSMFTLEALGLLYMNLMKYTSVGRNISLAVLLVPISFASNIVRVVILVLVTYHFGDEAGQGFVHGFAGMVLFLVALTLMLIVDKALNLVFPERRQG